MGLGGVRGLVCLVHGLGWGQEDIAIPLGLLELQLAAGPAGPGPAGRGRGGG